MTRHAVTVRHNFETGHRLPHLSGKCENLHGHSWWAEVTVSARSLTEGTVVEFGALKAALRGWIDVNLDHGLMLGTADPLSELLQLYGKVFVFGLEEHATDLAYPTVENVAVLLARVGNACLLQLGARGVAVSHVKVCETHVNAAEWWA